MAVGSGMAGVDRLPRPTAGAPARRPVSDPVFALGVSASDWGTGDPDLVEASLAELDQDQVDDDHRGQRREEARG